MSLDLANRLRDLYAGETGHVWDRIERESPATYWEENAVLGRRDCYAVLLERLRPTAGRRVLDAGCGSGLLARRLTREGARVTAVDLVAHRLTAARDRGGGNGPAYAVADFRDLLGNDTFDDVVIQEVLEEYGPEERHATFRALSDCRAGRIHVVFKAPGRWDGLISPVLPEALRTSLDPVALMRSVHLHSPYRLAYQESIRRRSYSVRLVGFALQADLEGGN